MLRTEFDEKEVANELKNIGYIEGKTNATMEFVEKMLKKNYLVKDISDITGLPVEAIEKIKADNKL